MTQQVILTQFQQYLEVTWGEYITHLNDEYGSLKDPDKIKQLQQQMRDQKEYVQIMHESLARGHCFGLSICHAAMTLLGKQAWWQDALVHLYHWDGKVESLDKPVELRDARGGRTITLRQIFELAMNYILHSHASVVKGREEFYPVNVTQQTALLPSASASDADVIPPHMEMVDEDGRVRTIQKNQRVVGNFSKKQLAALLQEETFKKNICLLHSTKHTVHVSCLGSGRWQLYDPNLSHESLDEMLIEGTKEEVIDAMFDQNESQALAVEVAAIDPHVAIDLSAYDDFMRRTPAALLTADSLFLFAIEAPDRLQELLKLAARIPDGAELKTVFARIITDAKYSMNRNALQLIAEYAPAALPDLFVLANLPHGEPLRIGLAKALHAEMADERICLEHIIKRAPSALPELWKLMSKTQECKKLWRDVVDNKSPQWCEVRTEIAWALSAKDSNHHVVLHTIMRESPAEMRELIVLVLSDLQRPQNLIALLKALAKTVDERTGWQLITANMSDKAELLHMLSAKLNDVGTPDLVRLGGELNRALTDENSMFRGLCNERHKLFRGHYGKTSIWKILIGKSQEILRNRKDAMQHPGVKEVLNIKVGR